jgi:hypothetical protein
MLENRIKKKNKKRKLKKIEPARWTDAAQQQPS